MLVNTAKQFTFLSDVLICNHIVNDRTLLPYKGLALSAAESCLLEDGMVCICGNISSPIWLAICTPVVPLLYNGLVLCPSHPDDYICLCYP